MSFSVCMNEASVCVCVFLFQWRGTLLMGTFPEASVSHRPDTSQNWKEFARDRK